ncbi:MAG TPA: substrate-binding domain-containing protein [Solirubrobacteraceae bacterium]|jgi:ABC-type phosphate transport system substrate-binding protein
MTSFSARRLIPACIVSAAALVALAAPGAANAALGTQCSGSNITGQGSSLQKLAQGVWDPAFNTQLEKHACNGTQGTKGTPTVSYSSTGSGAGLKSWGVGKVEHHYEATNAFVGTDEAPNPTAKGEIEENEISLIPKTVATVPVLQAAVAVIVNLPEKCVGTSTSNKGRLVLNNSTLEAIWRGSITKWSEIKENGDKVSGTGCNPETPIQHIVRFDGSGTTHIFKKYLGLISKTSFETTNFAGESTGSKTWDEIAEGPENTSWPTADAVKRPGAKGGGELVSLVAATPSSIGYANVADARANTKFIPPEGGANKATFWVPIQNKTIEPVTYQDPASNKEIAKLGESNCAKEEYTNGTVAFPPANVQESWSEVTTKTVEPKYTICGLTFDLAFIGGYSDYTGTSLEEATTVNNFLQFVLDPVSEKEANKKAGGQFLIKNHDYEPLVGTVLKEAQQGAAKISY